MSPVPDTRTDDNTMQTYRAVIQRRLAALRRRMRLQLIVEGFAWALGTALLLAAISLISDRWLRLDLPVRISLLVAAVIALIVVAIRRLYRPVTVKLDDLDLAELLERRQQGVGQKLSNVLLLPQLAGNDSAASPTMIRAAVKQDFDALEKVDLQSSLDTRRRRNAWLLILGILTPAIVFCVAQPSMANLWVRRWFHGEEIRWPQLNYLSIVGLKDVPRLQVPKGESTLLQIESQPEFQREGQHWILTGRGQPLIIESDDKPQPQIPSTASIKLRMSDGSERVGTLTQFSPGQFRYELPPLFESAEMSVTGGDDWFGPIHIEPIDRPAVEHLTIRATTPGKSEPDVFEATDNEKQLLFLPGTRLQLSVTSNQPLEFASAAVSGSDKRHDFERQSETQFEMNTEVNETTTLEFHLKATTGLESKPYFLTYGILNDRPPRLTLRSTGVGKRVTPVVRIPLHLRVLDDFGLAEVNYELEETHLVESKPATSSKNLMKEVFNATESSKLPLDVNREPTMVLAEFAFNPGTMLRVRAQAKDACALGVQSADSRWLTFQVVTSDELFYEVLTRQREQRSRFGKAVEQAKGQIDSLNKLTSAPEASQIIRNHQAMTRQVWQVATQLEASLIEMDLNDLGTSTGRDLLKTSIIQPLKELHDRPLIELLKKLSAVINGENVNEDNREAAIQAQTEVVQLMQRILDQMSQWESFIDVVNQLRHVIASQEKIRESTEQMQKKQISDVFDE